MDPVVWWLNKNLIILIFRSSPVEVFCKKVFENNRGEVSF